MKSFELNTEESMHSQGTTPGGTKRRSFRLVTWVVIVVLLLAGAAVALVLFGYDKDHDFLSTLGLGPDDLGADESFMLIEMKERLQPKELVFQSGDKNTTVVSHNFMHLHHMKTGGTSMDHRLKCAMARLQKDQEVTIPYGNIHECSHDRYYDCRDGKNPSCNQKLADASFMSYCAPLKDLPAFQWDSTKDDIHAITVLRHPVDRVWSMFRFQTKGCYKCMKLTEIYEDIDNGNTNRLEDLCVKQLQNHETANLLSTEWPDDAKDQDMIDQAVENMKHFFTAIGITEQLDATVNIFGRVFPWFQIKVEWSNTICPLPHDNASPRNNRCGEGGTHWDLPSEPDEETRLAIEAHNQLDIALYNAAVAHFELQKRAIFGD